MQLALEVIFLFKMTLECLGDLAILVCEEMETLLFFLNISNALGPRLSYNNTQCAGLYNGIRNMNTSWFIHQKPLSLLLLFVF